MFNNRVNSNCKGCTEREVGCHTTCEKYKEYKREQEEFNAVVNASKAKYAEYTAYKYSKGHIEIER